MTRLKNSQANQANTAWDTYIDENITEIKLEPITVKALYLTFWGANINSKTIKNILDIIDKTEISRIPDEKHKKIFFSKIKKNLNF